MSLSYGDESTIRAYFLVEGMGWVNKTSDRAATLPVIFERFCVIIFYVYYIYAPMSLL